MTDFLDRIVARVLPVQGRGGVVQTRPRSRFEEPWSGEAAPGDATFREAASGREEVQGASTPREGTHRGDEARGPLRGEGGAGTGLGIAPGDDPGAPGPGGAAHLRRGEGGAPGVRGRPGDLSPEPLWPGDRAPGMRRSGGEEGRGAQEVAAQAPPPDAGAGPAFRRRDLRPSPASAAGRAGGDAGEVVNGLGSPPPETPPLRLRRQPHPGAGVDRGPMGGRAPDGSSMTGGLSLSRGEAGGAALPGGRRNSILRPSGGAASLPPVDPTPPPIQLRIGRLEIRGNAPAPAPRRTPVAPPQPRSPALDLAEYLRRRTPGKQP